jgi:hypothetical protein
MTRLSIPTAIAIVLALASSAQAQKRDLPLLIEVAGAYVVTTGSYSDLVKNGWGAQGLIGYNFARQVWLMGSFAVNWHEGEGDLPTWQNYAYFGMLGYDALPPNTNGDIIFYAGAGGVRFVPDVDSIEGRTYFGLNGGLKIAYDFSPRMALTVNASAVVAFSEEDFNGGTTWFFPLGVGLAVRL